MSSAIKKIITHVPQKLQFQCEMLGSSKELLGVLEYTVEVR